MFSAECSASSIEVQVGGPSDEHDHCSLIADNLCTADRNCAAHLENCKLTEATAQFSIDPTTDAAVFCVPAEVKLLDKDR